MQGQTLEAAAAAAGMSERSASTWQDGPMPSATITSRAWRTRKDPFAAVWATEIEPYLRSDEDGELLATTLMDELCRQHPEDFQPGQVRTLQRQIRSWRAIHGPRREVFLPQTHQPGHLGAFRLQNADLPVGDHRLAHRRLAARGKFSAVTVAVRSSTDLQN